jgi:hypothetical protein
MRLLLVLEMPADIHLLKDLRVEPQTAIRLMAPFNLVVEAVAPLR